LKEKFIDFKSNWKKYVEFMIKGWGLGLVLMSLSNLVIAYFIPVSTPENEVLIEQIFAVVPIYMLWSTVLYAPIVEEMIFRHSIRKVIKSKCPYIIVSGLVFGLTHVIYSADTLGSLLYFIPYSFIGWGLAWVYTKTDNIYSTIIMHLLHNGILVGLLFLRIMVMR
jgi:membrane protease YdiL (CAAX protease family)